MPKCITFKRLIKGKEHMRICGIEFKSSETILVVIDRANDEVKYLDCKVKKITLKDDEIQSDVQSFCNEVSSFF